MKYLVYTFRTFPCIEELRTIFPDVCVFGKLKQDLARFKDLILAHKPPIIIGVAESPDQHSYIEPKTINRFNKTRKIIKSGEEELELFIPDLKDTNFKVSAQPSDSFCNYTMYKIKAFLESEKINAKFMFVHIKQKDSQELVNIVRKVERVL